MDLTTKFRWMRRAPPIGKSQLQSVTAGQYGRQQVMEKREMYKQKLLGGQDHALFISKAKKQYSDQNKMTQTILLTFNDAQPKSTNFKEIIKKVSK